MPIASVINLVPMQVRLPSDYGTDSKARNDKPPVENVRALSFSGR